MVSSRLSGEPAQLSWQDAQVFKGRSAFKLALEEDLVALLQELNQPIERSARELMVLELYRRGTISSGKAAELLGMSRWEFVRYASRLGIAFFDMTKDEWEAEVQQAETL